MLSHSSLSFFSKPFLNIDSLPAVNSKNTFIGVGLFFENRQEARKLGLLPPGKSFEAEREHKPARKSGREGEVSHGLAGRGGAEPR